MGEFIGLGTTHSPPLMMPDKGRQSMFEDSLKAPNVDPRYRDQANWPADMVAEMGNDRGVAASTSHRERLISCFRQQRKILDEFKPDFVIIFGDDQYENFQEDIIPPFCIFGLDDTFETEPWKKARYGREENAWGHPQDWKLRLHGHREGAKCVATGLIKRGMPIAYAYKLLHQEALPQAFQNTVMFLDYDLKGFPFPIVPFQINSYGSDVIVTQGRSRARQFEDIAKQGLPDPPAPSPAVCMDLGVKLAETILASPYRVVLMASSSWSHASLSSNTGHIIPDHESDRRLLDAFKRGDYDYWRALSGEQLENAGQHELLNWMPMMGAMSVQKRKPVVLDYAETYLFQANKVFAYFPQNPA